MTYLLLDLDNPTMKSIEMYAHTIGGVGKGCSSLGVHYFSFIVLENITFMLVGAIEICSG
jgi:hypothetical protein